MKDLVFALVLGALVSTTAFHLIVSNHDPRFRIVECNQEYQVQRWVCWGWYMACGTDRFKTPEAAKAGILAFQAETYDGRKVWEGTLEALKQEREMR